MNTFRIGGWTTANHLLAQLPPEEYERLSPYLEPVTLTIGDVIHYPQDPVTHVYFPNSGTVSVVATLEDGGGVEVGVVGNEGMFGVNAVLGSVTTPHEALVQQPGDGLRAPTDVIRQEFKKCGQLQDLILRYTQAFIIQIAQTAACNRSHPLGGRLARWLLMSHDRAMKDELLLTHDFIAVMLGTRRAGVSEAAGKLQNDGVIKYKRGHIQIVDRKGLESISCECYPIVKKEFERLLGSNAQPYGN
ncbi:MAG TPA: Crp/Fnr family transcriptional regulator [Pyrinomonadaceae bacterium]|jgi:CRP-like cAMP-binding protein|nr:Crp/Fnr family transcriptional regulator [Pyrinomonadaceae bacterium]